MNTIDVFLRFENAAAALAVAEQITRRYAPELPPEWTLTELPVDGGFGGNRFDIIIGQPPLQLTGSADPESGEPVMVPQPGLWIVGRWRGPDPLPEELRPHSVEPWGQIIG
ncbi:hypothetical protein [Rhizobium straminoryzae]|uniref:Uncharacterized protein n=1 Tax=Rhizobium straminoryzae TaxID=1387186 RepID=A0A549T0Z2_9HYPH|nr:hypothetical protein [Rhizobium straminoryzae]TRL35478.1 hypothetical protein FNA46_19955 [Rhizobium straminoryzae]